MNSLQKNSILVIAACSIGLTACRQEKQERKSSSGTVERPHEALSMPEPAPTEHKESIAEVPKKAGATIAAGDQIDEAFVMELIAKQMERNRLEVFDVPLNEKASRDRSDAWAYLTCAQFAEPLSSKKWVYARDLLDRYKDATAIEKLVFWRLIGLRMYEQGVSNTSRYLEEGVDPRVERGMPAKLTALLYSALGEDPSSLPDFLASRRAIEILKQAGQK